MSGRSLFCISTQIYRACNFLRCFVAFSLSPVFWAQIDNNISAGGEQTHGAIVKRCFTF